MPDSFSGVRVWFRGSQSLPKWAIRRSTRKEIPRLDAIELLTSNLACIERVIAFACCRYRFDANDAEELGAIVKLRLVDNDYAILRAYEQRCQFQTYMSIIVQRMALDYRIHVWGRWQSSAEAKRLGPLAVDLEQLLHRDGRRLDDAVVALSSKYEDVTRASLEVVSRRLPSRAPRRREVNLQEADRIAIARSEQVEDPLLDKERQQTSRSISALMSEVIARMPEDERLILQLRFEGGQTVAQIARALHIDQKLLYRRLDRRLRDIRAELEGAGLASADVLDVIGRNSADIHFELGKPAAPPLMRIARYRQGHLVERAGPVGVNIADVVRVQHRLPQPDSLV
jgi:RNA polymerase sigma factor (sigma-70 family)